MLRHVYLYIYIHIRIDVVVLVYLLIFIAVCYVIVKTITIFIVLLLLHLLIFSYFVYPLHGRIAVERCALARHLSLPLFGGTSCLKLQNARLN